MPTASTAAASQVSIEIHANTNAASSSRSTTTRLRTFKLRDLPPLPEPRTDVQMQESSRGISLVLGLSALLVTLPHVTGYHRGLPSFAPDAPNGRAGAMVALYVCALLAIVCLISILCGDPGIVHRSDENCFPLPVQVQQRLEGHASLDGLNNITAKNGRVFCVRCCIWRPKSRSDIHHCSICQRARACP